MQSARLDRSPQPLDPSAPPAKAEVVSRGPNAVQAAAYIHDMTTTLRNLAVQQNLTTLALLLEMAAVEAGSIKPPQL